MSHSLQFKLLNPLINAFFAVNDPSKSHLKDIYFDLKQNPYAYALIVPSTHILLNFHDSVSGTPLSESCFKPDFLKDHLIDLRGHNGVVSRSQNVIGLLNSKKSKQFKSASGKDLLLKKDQILVNTQYWGAPEVGKLCKFEIKGIELFVNFNSFFNKNTEFLLIHIETPLIGNIVGELELGKNNNNYSGGYSAASSSSVISSSSVANSSSAVANSASSASFTSSSAKSTSFTELSRRFSSIPQQLGEDYYHLFSSFVLHSINDPLEIATLFRETVNQSALIFRSLPDSVLSQILAFDANIDLNRCIYDYVELNLYDRIFARLKTILDSLPEKRLTADTYSRLQSLSITQVGVFEDSSYRKRDQVQRQMIFLLVKITAAAKILVKMSISSTYYDKLDILVQTVTELTKQETLVDGVLSMDVNADVLVALMILVVIRAKVPDIHVHLEYIKNFSYGDISSGFGGYCISTLEAVLYHLQNQENLDALCKFSSENALLWATVSSQNPHKLASFMSSYADKWPIFVPIDSVFRSVTSQGESCLMLAAQNRNPEMVRLLLTYNESWFPVEDILSDYNCNGVTVFAQALMSENFPAIDALLELVLNPISCTVPELISYFNHKDYGYQRNIGHYLHHYRAIIDQVSLYIDWRDKDITSNTPLMSLCRNYDIADYGSLVQDVFSQVQNWYSYQNKPFSFCDHIDSKGNTLLHVLKDEHLGPLLDSNILVSLNQFNDKGYSPLVVALRYNRVHNVTRLLKEPALNIDKRDKSLLTVLDYVKSQNDTETEQVVDSYYLKNSFPVINNRKFGILRAKIDNNQWHFVLKGIIFEKTAGSKHKIHHYSNYRSITDFKQLIHLLHIESPVSYMPIVYLMESVFSRLNLSTFTFFNFNKLKINEMILKLNIFLTGIQLSRGFFNHELVWEFLILPPSNQMGLEERSRLKVESHKEKLVYSNTPSTPSTPHIDESPISRSPNIPEEFTDSGFENMNELFEIDKAKNYRRSEVEDILTFLHYSTTELENFNKIFRKIVQLLVVASHKSKDMNDSLINFAQILENNPLFVGFEGYFAAQSRKEQVSEGMANDMSVQTLKPLSGILRRLVSEDEGTEFVSHKKFVFYLQFMENCINRLIKNITSVINKKINKWLRLHKDLAAIKQEIRRIRPEDFEHVASDSVGNSSVSSPTKANSVFTENFGSDSDNSFLDEASINPFSDVISGHRRSVSTSSAKTIVGVYQEPIQESLKEAPSIESSPSRPLMPLQKEVPLIGAPPLAKSNPPVISITQSPDPKQSPKPTQSPSQSPNIMGSPLRALRSPPSLPVSRSSSPIRPPFPQSSNANITTQVLSAASLSTPNSKSSSPLRAAFLGRNQPGQPGVKKKRSFFTNILETRKQNYELKVVKSYKINRLKLMTLSNDVKYNHELLATEVNNFMEFKEIFLKYSIKVFVKDEIKRLKFRHTSLCMGRDDIL